MMTDEQLAEHCDECRWWAENFDEYGVARVTGMSTNTIARWSKESREQQ